MTRAFKEVDGLLFSGTIAASGSADTMCIKVKQGSTQLSFRTTSDQASCTVQPFRVDESGVDRSIADAASINQNEEDEQAIVGPAACFYFLRVANGSGSPANVTVAASTTGAG